MRSNDVWLSIDLIISDLFGRLSIYPFVCLPACPIDLISSINLIYRIYLSNLSTYLSSISESIQSMYSIDFTSRCDKCMRMHLHAFSSVCICSEFIWILLWGWPLAGSHSRRVVQSCSAAHCPPHLARRRGVDLDLEAQDFTPSPEVGICTAVSCFRADVQMCFRLCKFCVSFAGDVLMMCMCSWACRGEERLRRQLWTLQMECPSLPVIVPFGQSLFLLACASRIHGPGIGVWSAGLNKLKTGKRLRDWRQLRAALAGTARKDQGWRDAAWKKQQRLINIFRFVKFVPSFVCFCQFWLAFSFAPFTPRCSWGSVTCAVHTFWHCRRMRPQILKTYENTCASAWVNNMSALCIKSLCEQVLSRRQRACVQQPELSCSTNSRVQLPRSPWSCHTAWVIAASTESYLLRGGPTPSSSWPPCLAGRQPTSSWRAGVSTLPASTWHYFIWQ